VGKLEQRTRHDAARGFPSPCSIGTDLRSLVSWVPTCSRRRVSPAVSAALLLTLSACTQIERRVEPYLIRDWAEFWFGISLFLWLGLGLPIVTGLLWRALSKWNLADGGPRTRPAFYTLVVSAVLCPVAFMFMNFLWDGPIPPEQRLWNSLGWAIGSAVGAIVAWQGGKWLIARQYRKRFPVRTRENS
jgi:hypothetical protein